jgi:hypothetical protein
MILCFSFYSSYSYCSSSSSSNCSTDSRAFSGLNRYASEMSMAITGNMTKPLCWQKWTAKLLTPGSYLLNALKWNPKRYIR